MPRVGGHHLQISTTLGLEGLPLIRQQTLYTAYAKGWSREQAIDYMDSSTSVAQGDVVSEVERYMAPGQACAYKVDQLKILELRQKARAALGARFDLKEFHSVVLESGGVPLTLLEPLVDEWIARVRSERRGRAGAC